MKKIYTYLSMLIILLAASCQQEDLATAPALQPGEYRFSVTIPEPVVASRALGEQPQDVTSMPMHVLVFDENGFFIANQTATVNSFERLEGTYTVSLPKNDGKTILHFVLGDVAYGTYAPTATEVSIFSALTVGDGQDAYWARTEIDGGISEDTQLPFVTLVRNFAKITLTAGQGVPATFQLLGFAIVNETTEGTVAPYTGSGFATFGLSGPGDAYTEFRTENPGFGGNSAGSLDDTTPEDADFTTEDKYVYERNQDEAANPAYILVKAMFNGQTCYYKLDIVRQDEDTWLTSYLNLYRNFAYHVTINSVAGAGYNTPEQAMNAVASNNISASVEVSQVNSIQDGQGNVLTVDDLDIMITKPEAYSLGYEYREGAENGSEGQVHNGEEYVRIIPVYEDSDDGINRRAVQSIVPNYNDADGIITITPVNPLPEVMETQEFVVTTRSGLSRRVTVNVRKPFNFDAVDCDDLVESTIGSELTLVVRLPQNMSTSVFPLTLDIEPDKKSIYPDVAKNRIPVVAEGNYTFQYRATVTYNDYRRNSTLFFHFKTNMTNSATSITVSNDYFEPTDEHPNTCSFENTDTPREGFGDVTLNGETDIYHFNTYLTEGQTLTLAFDLPCESTTHSDGSNPVEIFADYLDLEHAQTSTGTFTLRSDGEGILYEPNDATQRQEITFTVTQDYASETIQLSARDHKTATIDYTTPSLTLTLYYQTRRGPSPVPNRTEVSIYKDANYSEFVTSKTVSNGQILMDTFVGFTGTDLIYFSCEINRTTYRGSMTVEELIQEKSITLRN